MGALSFALMTFAFGLGTVFTMPVDPISPPAKIHPEEAALNLGFGQYAIGYSFTNRYVHSAECIYGGGGEYCPRVQIIYSTYVINLSIIIYNPF